MMKQKYTLETCLKQRRETVGRPPQTHKGAHHGGLEQSRGGPGGKTLGQWAEASLSHILSAQTTQITGQ